MDRRRPKVLVAMSGGVDSSVAAALLVREGYDVVGCFMRLGSPGETLEGMVEAGDDGGEGCSTRRHGSESRGTRIGHQGCCSINDAADARLVAAKLGVPFYVCNFKKDFGRIIDYFVGEYNAGRTPNPCVRCNDWLKFGRLHEYAKQIDADFVASGHYARIEATERRSDEAMGCDGATGRREAETRAGWDSAPSCHEPPGDHRESARLSPRASRGTGRARLGEPRYRLLRGIDHDKDQSYVLFGTPRERLGEMLLPIGGLTKSRVREIAAELDLPVFDKPDSQEICFVPDNDYAGLVRRRTPGEVRRGRIVDASGSTIGEHDGHQHFTIGQRRGIGIALNHPLYVIEKDAQANTITVGEKSSLAARGCIAGDANWLVEPPHEQWTPCTAKIRYNAEPVPAQVRRRGPDDLEVQFDDPQFAVAPGQALVCYDGEMVMGGGWIRAGR